MTVEQKRMPEYNHYAKKSLVLAIIILCLLFVFWLLLYSPAFSGHTLGDIFIIFLFTIIVIVVMAILGVRFGKRGLKSEKVGMSIFGLVISGIVLLSLIGIVICSIIYFATGGEIA
jgi:cation transport ATPase